MKTMRATKRDETCKWFGRMGLAIGVLAVAGCSAPEPGQDAAENDSSAAAATARAPEDAEATALIGHKLSVKTKLDMKMYGQAALGMASLDVMTKGDRRDSMECIATALGEKSGAARWVDPGDYVVADILAIPNHVGVDVRLFEKDGTTPSDWSVQCFTQVRKPLAREVMSTIQKYITVDPAVLTDGSATMKPAVDRP